MPPWKMRYPLYGSRSVKVKFTLAGLFFDYLVFALIFSYPSATHDYYQIVLFPITALMLGQAAVLIANSKRGKKIKIVLFFSLLFSGVVFSLYHQHKFMKGDFEMRINSPAYFLVDGIYRLIIFFADFP